MNCLTFWQYFRMNRGVTLLPASVNTPQAILIIFGAYVKLIKHKILILSRISVGSLWRCYCTRVRQAFPHRLRALVNQKHQIAKLNSWTKMLDQNQLVIGISVLLSFFVGYKYGLKISRKGENLVKWNGNLNSRRNSLQTRKIRMAQALHRRRSSRQLLVETTRWFW